MASLLPTAPRFAWLQHTAKGAAVIVSTCAALASIMSALHSNGLLGKTISNSSAAWVRLTPSMDTATAIGDTVPFAAMIASRSGSVLADASPTWTTGDSSVATVSADGSVIARGPGTTTISVVVGKIVTSAHILVKQRVTGVTIAHPARDSGLALLEGNQLQLQVRALDARGHAVQGRATMWHTDDTLVASIDGRGMLSAQGAGRSAVSATVDGVSIALPVTVEARAAALTVVAGSGQRALAGRVLPHRVVVRAVTRRGAPASGKAVTFRVRGGSVEPATATTDADGRAAAQWTLGDDPGAQALLANVEQVDSTIVVEAEAEPSAANTRVTPLTVTMQGRAGATLGDSVGVRVTDSVGRALAGVPVRWIAADGAVEASAPRTDSAGVALARWTLATRTGTQRVRALVGATDSRIAPAAIVATAMAGPPTGIVVVSGDHQREAAGKLLARPVVLRVVDAAGNGAAGVSVALAASAGSLADSTLVTDSLGMVRVRWTMGHSAGDHTLAARVDGLKAPVKIGAHATPARAANLSFDDAPPLRGAKPNTRRLVAIVTDVYGNPVAETAVAFGVKSGAVTPARAVTDAQGRVTLSWMMGAGAGEQTLRGTVRGSDVAGAYVARAEHADAGKAAPPKRKAGR